MSKPEYTLTKHRGKLAVTFYEGGSQRKLSTGTDDPTRAEIIGRRIWDQRNQIQTDRVEDLWDAYIRHRAKSGFDTNKLDCHWKALKPYFGRETGNAITEDDCRAYFKKRKALGYSNSTIKTDLEYLRAALKHHYGKHHKLNIWLPAPSVPRSRWLTKEEVRNLVQAASSPHIGLFITLGIATGARAGAIVELTWDRVDFDHKTVDFRPENWMPSNKGRTIVPLNQRAMDAMEQAYEARLTDHVIEFGGKPVKSVKKALERLAKKTGIPFSAHVLRHTAGVWMAQADVPMQKISQYLAHRSLKITESVYARYSPSYMRDASDSLDF